MKFLVENMTCGHCVKAINQAILGRDSGANIHADVASKSLEIQNSLLTVEQVTDVLHQEGYITKFVG